MLIQMIQTIIRSKTETVVFFADFKEKKIIEIQSL